MSEENVVPINEDVEVESPEPMSILQATQSLAGEMGRIAKATKTTPEFCMNIYAFFYQQEEAARMRAEQQAAIDASGIPMQELSDAHKGLPAEEITSDE